MTIILRILDDGNIAMLQTRYNCGTHFGASKVMNRKTETLNLCVTPELKELIKLAADKDHRTISNFVEMLVRQYCTSHGVTVETKRPESC